LAAETSSGTTRPLSQWLCRAHGTAGIDRCRQLEELISQRTGTRVLGQITELARALPRAQVVDRARATLDS
jgi:hypothetical protein